MTTTVGPSPLRRSLRRDQRVRPAGDDTDEHRGRTVTKAVQLPTGRAIVGGLLVAVSGLGIFAAHRAATVPDSTNWLIVRRPVAAGATISADDLALAPMTLAETTRRRALTDPDDVLGRIALVPLDEGDLVLRSSTAASADDAATPGRRVGLSLDASDALGGDLLPGDRVDVVAIPPTDGTSEVIVHGALVSDVGGEEDGGVGSVSELRIVLEVPDEAAARRVIDAHADAGVTLIAASTVTLGPDSSPASPASPASSASAAGR